MNFTRIISRFSCFLLFVLFSAYGPAQIRLAAVGGVHSSSFRETNSIPGFDTAQGRYFSSKTGIQLGVLLEIPLPFNNFYFQPGINYSSKGNQYERFYDTSLVQSDTLYSQHTLKLNYVEFPLYLTYKFPLSKNKRNYFYLGAGPYFGFIYSASQPYQNQVRFYNEEKYTYNSGTTDLGVGNGSGKYKTLDIGIKAKAGFELGNVMLGVYFSRGLSNAYEASYPASFHHQLIGASIGIWLNKAKVVPDTTDTDRDGILDRFDSCKTVAGTPKYSGCPVPDTDMDGVNDDMDSCKNEKGFARYHGCPVPDSDRDGLNDEEDSCKTTAGSLKYHGCPVPDSDGDGINDDTDQCIDKPGTAENKGCPLVKPELSKRILFVAQNIQFRSNSTKLTGSSLPSLLELADTLNTNPDLELTVEGHTDNSGSPEYNQILSEQRAAEVKKVLVSMGIPEERISTRGFGDTQPVGDNKTREGKAMNRRVVLRLHVKNS
jgi:outer membrane protein OmpA-like peptidoglycan-associated protein